MFDVPTTTATLEAARALLSPRAQAGLDGLPAEQRAITAHAISTGAYLELWDRRLSEGQPMANVSPRASTPTRRGKPWRPCGYPGCNPGFCEECSE